MKKPFLSNFESDNYSVNNLDEDSTITTERVESSDCDLSNIGETVTRSLEDTDCDNIIKYTF
ncbi:hypothetical protein ACN2EN_05280 [Aliarcobacter lanthieri]|uniref:hypothetical protein n=1 Tax=Aliarcobacter lanthieri TaxID=1355374 RepID=UPI003AFA2DB3